MKRKPLKSKTMNTAKNQENYIFIDGKFFPKSQATVSVFDHGLLYGDGVFEGMRSYNGLVFRMKEHLNRLWESAKTIMLEIPYSKKDLESVVIATLEKNRLLNAYIRLVVTRGTGDLGLDPRKCKVPTVFIITDKITLYSPELYQQGVEIITVPTLRNHPEAVNPCIKSLNYLNNILAKIEAIQAGSPDAIMLNKDGFVTECTGANIFIIKEGELFTPPTYVGVLKGITRGAIIDSASKLHIPFREKVLTRHDLFNAEECFLTGTAAEIVPVVQIDGRVIGKGKPGVTTQSLQAAFQELTGVDGVRYKV